MLCSEILKRELAPLQSTYFQLTREWTLSGLFGATYPALLVETYHYVKHSVPLMARACAQLGDETRIQSYLAHHMAEEVAHEQWALEDLERLGFDRGDVKRSLPLPETISMIGSQLYIVDYVDPIALMGYILVMESMPPKQHMLDAVFDTYSIPRDAMKFLSGHGEADQQHMLEIAAAMDESITSSERIAATVLGGQLALDGITRLFRRISVGDFLSSTPMRMAA